MNALPVYKLLSEADWGAAVRDGLTTCALDVADGYVHLSTRQQVEVTARKYYSGASQVRLLRFAPGRLAPVRWEVSRGGDLFPHLYGPLEIAAAEASWWLAPGPDGAPVFPEAF